MQPSQKLANAVRAGFILKGTSLNKFCLSNAIDVSNAKKALLGSWNGPKAIALREKLVTASAGNQESRNEQVD